MDDGEIRGPLDFGQTLDATFKLLRRCYLPLFLLTLAVAIPVAVLSGAAIDATTTSYDVGAAFAFNDNGITYENEAAFVLVQLGSTLVQALIPALILVFCLPLVLRRARGDAAFTLGASIRESLSHWWPLLVMSVLSGLGVLLGFVFCLIPGIFLVVLWLVATPALLDEKLSGTAALGRSRELVQGRWWATFGRYLTVSLIAGVAGNIVARGVGAIAEVAFDPTSTGALALLESGNALSMAITTPLTVCLIAVIYTDLKARFAGAPAGDVHATSETGFRGFAPPSPGA
ncbi:MAG TPA: hypothetical protein VNT22_06140 [Baekduia sp.]|nr:hypothetical protein [Baekduia sp.]